MKLLSKLNTISIVTIAIVCGCSTTSKVDLVQYKNQYLDAIRVPQSIDTPSVEKKCLQLISLSKDKRFYIRDVAAIRAYLNCPDIKKIEKLVNIDKINIEEKPWLKEVYFEAQIRRYQQLQNHKLATNQNIEAEKTLEAQFLIEKSKIFAQTKPKVELLQNIMKDFTDVLTTEQINELNERLQTIAPRFIVNPTPQDYVKVASDYRSIRDFKNAQNFYELVINDKTQNPDLINHAYKGLRQSYKLQNNKKDFIKTTKRWYDWAQAYAKINKWSPQSTEIFADSSQQLIRALWTENQLSQAKYYLKKAFQKIGHRYPMGDFIFIEARMSEEKQNFEEAVEIYTKMNQQQKLSVLQKSRALWGLAWNLRKLKKYPEAQTYFEELALNAQEPGERYKYWFWIAKNKIDQIPLGQSKEDILFHLKNLVQQDHIGYYGLMAQYELSSLFAPEEAFIQKPAAQEQVKTPELNIIESQRHYLNQLLSVEEYDIAKLYVDFITQNLKEKNLLSSKDWIYILQKYAQSKLYLPLFAAFNKLDEQSKSDIINSNVELLFPRDYFSIIDETAQKYNFPAEFILAIIRQESAFDTMARSHADAMGLMQLLPQVAEKLAVPNKISYTNFDDLYKPEINIPLGTLLLRQLLARHQQQYIIAIASYNADENAVKTWIKTRYRGDVLEFIEDIPYEETKGYVKLVLRNIMFYQKLITPQEQKISAIDKYLYIKNN